MTTSPLLGPDTVAWKVNHEPAVYLGGGRALLLQVAHPLVAAGVEQHSDYQANPWARLHRTLDTVVKIAFGEREISEAAANRLIRRHDYVKGVSEDGVRYEAQDPDLLVWVWATLLDTSLVMYGRCRGRLPDEERDRFYDEQKLFAYACGVPRGYPPGGWDDFSTYWERMLAEELRVTDAARAVADSIVNPTVPRLLRPLFRPNTLLTAGLLPPTLREEYGFEWGPTQERRLDAVFAALRAGSHIVPRRARHFPASHLASPRSAWLGRLSGSTPARRGSAPPTRTRGESRTGAS